MKTVSNWGEIEQYHNQCVCQTCTCHKHRCPVHDVDYPFEGTSLYQQEFHPHPINTWQKPPPEKARPYQPYGRVASSYKSEYPGHKPAMREKLKPRVKDEDRSVPFEGTSQYKKQFGKKNVDKDPVKNKDRTWTPDDTPFIGGTTYKDSYPKKEPNKHQKKTQPEYPFPQGYGFYGDTTYKNSYIENPLQKSQSYKPKQNPAPKGFHDLNSIYRDDFKPKKLPQKCPILKMPVYPKSIHHPHQHFFYNKFKMRWEEK